MVYRVQAGDTLQSIAERFNVSLDEILLQNMINEFDSLVIGQSIFIPSNLMNYEIKLGDSLYSISKKFNTTISNLQLLNPNLDNNNLQVGSSIVVPQIKEVEKRTIEVNGYVLPNIDSEVLKETLPYLTYISIFSYEVLPDGNITPIEDEQIIEMALNAGVAPLMVITNFDNESGFSSEIGSAILRNEQAQDILINNVIQTLGEKGYKGLNIDFEYLYPADREAYNSFLEKLHTALNESGYILTSAIAPKISADQQGLLYEAHDYEAHGKNVDRVILMTYEWGYLYGEPQAVSPILKVRQVLDYAVSVIPSYKILMGVNNYGYDWTLPFNNGDSARVISNVGAVNLARDVGATIMFDEKTQSPYFTYYDSDGKEHIVWFEDGFSMMSRLKLVEEYNLAGVSFWTINRFFPQSWLVLSELYNVKKL